MLLKPAASGSASSVGLARESAFGTTPTTGSDPAKTISNIMFIPMKEENIQGNANVEPQTDDMNGSREISRIIDNGTVNTGTLRYTLGFDSVGYIFTALLGSPATTKQADTSGSAEAAYQHIWYPGQQARANWPVSYSIESQMADTLRSKLIQGAYFTGATLDIANNRAAEAQVNVLAKDITWLYPTGTTGKGSGTADERGLTRPAVMTATPTFLDEPEIHFCHIKAYPQVTRVGQTAVDQQSVESISFEPKFTGLDGLFTGGSGKSIGSVRVDNFELSGRMNILFEDETIWAYAQNGSYFTIDITLEGPVIQGAFKNSIRIQIPSAKFSTSDVPNRAGTLAYDLPWTARRDPATGRSCTITVVNTTTKYDQ